MDGSLPPAEAVASFRTASGPYEAAGDPGEATAAAAGAAYARSLEAGRAREALAELAPLLDRALAPHAGGGATARQTRTVLMCRARVLGRPVREAPDEESAEAAVAGPEQGARELPAFTEPLRAERSVVTRFTEALDPLGDVTRYRGDPRGGPELYVRATAGIHDAGLPWYAVEYEARTAALATRLDEHDRAERAARAALEHRAAFVPAPGRAQLYLGLAEVLGAAGQFDEATEHAPEAGELWRELGDVLALVRTLRVRARIATRKGRSGPDAARQFMAAAERECEAAPASGPSQRAPAAGGAGGHPPPGR
ncbi:hypothetical protein ACIRP2_33745 [Streptomyces sp. NPDC101194]|uniref:hypothetical protein n=1 Tax=Streptomyces sp. NPDC101194 TaxID=3366127 RepID=UPI00381116DB